ncbi:MAG TPA: hypothetical protein PKC18_15895, partial [Lacipirellulaceae bacterium]|nr:hypothetical protein [Lacipirellulaceae bacterium]
WMLARPTPQGPHRDAMGPYPLFGCRQWRGLNADVAALAGRAVCVSLVTDPLADVTPQQLGEVFTDVCSPFKEHYVCDLSRPLESVVAPHHRRHIRKALRAVEVRRCGADGATLAQWNALYDALAARHGIEGIARFSPQSFARQWAVPGMVALAAMEGDHCCGMTLWYVDGDDAYYHLAAY